LKQTRAIWQMSSILYSHHEIHTICLKIVNSPKITRDIRSDPHQIVRVYQLFNVGSSQCPYLLGLKHLTLFHLKTSEISLVLSNGIVWVWVFSDGSNEMISAARTVLWGSKMREGSEPKADA
jgi:hypothetical protein